MSLLMIMAGGTGGHVYPALAVASEMRDRGVDVVWLGTEAGLEARAVPAAGIDIEWISITGLRGKGMKRWLVMPWLLARAVWQALEIVRRRRPDAMLGMGGFVSGPGAIAARLTRRPLVIHEQNAIAGMTNTWLKKISSHVLTGFPDTFDGAEHVGNPVRKEFFSVDRVANRVDPLRVLIVGGSQGALALNRALPETIAAMDKAQRPEVRHQCGRGRATDVAADYAARGVDAQAVEFIDDMAGAYEWADVVVCRSGAMTVAEVAATGTPAIFVPYPYAVSDHQSANANYLVRERAARVIAESQLDASSLAEILNELDRDRDELDAMGVRAQSLAKSDSTKRVADVCMEVLHA